MPTTRVLPPRLTSSAERVREAALRRGMATVVLPTWLAELPREFLRRPITAMPLDDAWWLRSSAFIKSPNDKSLSPNDKSLRAMIYSDGTRLPGADAVDGDTIVLRAAGPATAVRPHDRSFVRDLA